MLRSAQCVSRLEEFTDGKFNEVIDDHFVKAADVKRVLLCSGKVYYDLLDKQQTDKRKDVAVVRLEQLYPIPYDQLEAIQSKYKKATEFIWVQEEPENMGAWPYISRKFRNSSLNLELISRQESSSTATGYAKQHIAQQLNIVVSAFESKAGLKDKKQVKVATKKIVNID